MKKRVKEAEKLDRGKVNKDYFNPKRLLKQIEKEYKNKKLETEEPKIEPVSSIPRTDRNIQTTQLPDIQTPPLPGTPMPKINNQMAQNINPQTGLTRTESALLSPEEQIIRQRLRT